MPEFRFPFGAAGGGGAVPERLRPGSRGVNPKAPQTPRADLHVSLEADVERDREKESKRPKSRESPVALRGNYKNVTPWAGIPATALPCRARPSASSRRLRAQRPLSMGPARRLLLVAMLALLNHLGHPGLARSLPTATPGLGMLQCLSHSQNLLRAVGNMLQKARQTLEFYSCSSEEIDHEDITKDKTSTVEACLPLELTTNESCLASREISFLTNGSCLASSKASFMMTLCLSSIYEDLKMYQVEFKAMNAKLLMDPKRQISLDQNMLAAIDELMQALSFNSETVPQKPSLEEPDFYKTKIKLCILLHAFRIRVVTIDRMMSYLNSS
ncbi:interleukin-12 subunit alpha [Manis javanica]|uniref:interleukin-12 subunit alpha n=1 Tax=Manis javanica TaxID=9974 RepID=UPI000813A750|nr:interleukin-12 subunit alpha [Manis javanica]KAI5940083.1 Interleukin-12 subunit alpha [Manis javanica]